MQNSFKEKYNQTEKSKKLSFLRQLLEKDNNLQQQFLEFTKGQTVDDIEDIRTRIYNELVEIDNYEPVLQALRDEFKRERLVA